MSVFPKSVSVPLVLKLLLPLILGVIVAFYTRVEVSLNMVYGLLLVLVLLGVPLLSRQFRLRFLFAICSTVFFFLLGIHLVNIQTNVLNQHYFIKASSTNDTVYQVRLLDDPVEKENSIKFFASVCGVDDQPAMGKVLLYFEKTKETHALEYGDVLALRTNFQPILPNGNPKEFDYARYLKIHGVRHQAYVMADNYQKISNTANSFYAGILEVRSFLDDLLSKSGLAPAELMVAKALILGEKDSLDRDTLRTYSSAGAMHVLAVSGLHVGIVMLLLSFLFKPIKLFPRGRLIFMIVVLAGIWFYALITGMSSSVLRASVMFSFVLIGKEIERENSIYQSILVSAFLLILMEPLVIFQVGFQLSYLAVFGIIYLQPKIYNLIYVKNYLGNKIWQISSVSIAAQFATFPLGLYYFHQFPNFFMLSNLIVIPLAFAILLVGLVYFMVVWIPYLNDVLFFVLDFLITFLNKGVKWVESLPYSIYWGVSIEWYEVFWLYLILIAGAAAFILRKSKLILLTLSGMVMLLSYNVAENYFLNHTNQLVVYNVNDDVAIDLFNGRANYFMATKDLMQDEDKLLFHVKHNWFYRTGSENPTKALVLTNENSVINFHSAVLWLCSDSFVDSIPISDFVYLRQSNYFSKEFVEGLKTSQAFVILGDGIGYKARNFISAQLEPGCIHDLKAAGAFTYAY